MAYLGVKDVSLVPRILFPPELEEATHRLRTSALAKLNLLSPPPPRIQLESLSLALSHSLPTAFSSRRPSLPSWAQPATKEPSTPGAEEANDEHREGVAYWVHVKETLDREAEELKRERRRAWERIQGKAGTGTSEGVERPPGTG